MAGAHHSPESDVQAIAANLRDRYKSGFPVLKEIIQNSDDAGATELTIGWCDGVQGAEHPLLRDPGIFFINNEALSLDNVKGIMSIAFGDKADKKFAVGKFGLGMKSLFHFGEVFLFMASDWRMHTEKAEVFNPWSYKRKEWDVFGDHDKSLLENFLQVPLEKLTGVNHFIVWVPLRSESIMASRGPKLGTIINSHDYKRSLPEFLSDKLLSQKISNIFPLLKNLEVVHLCTFLNGQIKTLFQTKLKVDPDSPRMSFGPKIDLNGDSNTYSKWQGSLSIVEINEGEQKVDYFGSESLLLGNKKLSALKTLDNWPFSYGRDDNEFDQRKPDKNEPHSAVVITRRRAVKKEAQLTVQWAVFLPLGEQDITQESQSFSVNISGEYCYDILFHGYFFIDAGRVGIHGRQDIGSEIENLEVNSEDLLTREWNRLLANHGTLDCVIPAISGLVETYNLSQKETVSISNGVLGFLSDRKVDLKLWVTARHQWVYHISPSARGWLKLGGSEEVRILPAPVSGDATTKDYERIWATFPRLKLLSENNYIYAEELQPNIITDKAKWSKEEVTAILDIDAYKVFTSEIELKYLNKFLKHVFSENPEVRQNIQVDLVKIAMEIFSSVSLRKLSSQKMSVKNFLGLIFSGKRFAIKIDVDDQDVWEILTSCDTDTILIPTFLDDTDVPAKASLNIESTKNLILTLGKRLSATSKNSSTVGKVVLQLISSLSKEDQLVIHKTCGHLPLFPARNVGESRDIMVSRERLHCMRKQGLLFIFSGAGNYGLGVQLSKSLLKSELLFVKEAINTQLFQSSLPKCEEASVLQALSKEPNLSEPLDRVELLQRLSGATINSNERILALKYLIHGEKDVDVGDKLWFSRGKTGVWANIFQGLKQHITGDLLIIPKELSQIISGTIEEPLNIKGIQPEVIVEEHGNELASMDFSSIIMDQSEAEEVLVKIQQKDLWRELPLHTTCDGSRVKVCDLTVLEDTRKLPENLKSSVVRIAKAKNQRVRQQQEDFIGEIDIAKTIYIALSQPEPHESAAFILSSLSNKELIVDSNLEEKLKETPWIESSGSFFSPNQAVILNAAQYPEVAKLSAKSSNLFLLDEMAAIYCKNENVIKDLIPSGESLMRLIFSSAEKIPIYEIGQCGSLSAEIIKQAGSHPDAFTNMPGWQLISECADHLSSQNISWINCGVEALAKETENEQSLVDAHQYLSTGKHSLSNVKEIRSSILNAICSFADPPAHLSKMKFLARNGQFNPATKLAQNVVGLDDKYILHPDEWLVLDKALGHLDYDEAEETAKKPKRKGSSSATVLKKYFKDWALYVPEALIAPVLVLMSGAKPIRKLAKDYLGTRSVNGLLDGIGADWKIKDGHRKDEFFPQMSLGDVVDEMKFELEIFEDKYVDVMSISGSTFQAEINPSPDNIFFWVNTRHYHMHAPILQLVPMDLSKMDQADIKNILKQSAETLLDKIYKQKLNLDNLWHDLDSSDQLDVAVAKAKMMVDIVRHLRELKIRTDPIGRLLKKYDEDHEREIEAQHSDGKYKVKRKSIVSDIQNEIYNNGEIQRELLEGRRNKLKEYQYDESSVPFELFQNADDSMEERSEIEGSDSIWPDAQSSFIVEKSPDSLSFYHFGREVNHYRAISSDVNGKDRGFHTDLEKMLTLHISDKSDMTGKFGLGFKSCFLISDKPEIFSGRLAIEISAGMLPEVSANSDMLSKMVANYKSEGRSPTLVHLPLSDKVSGVEVLRKFSHSAGLLPVFSKRIRKIVVEDVEYQWLPVSCTEIKGLSFGYSKLPAKDLLRKQRVAHYQCDNGQFIFGLSPKGFVSLLDNAIPKLWVLNPLSESIPLGFVIESVFDIDVGRSQLARNSKVNIDIMQKLGRELALLFKNLFEWSQKNWSQFKIVWELDSKLTLAEFWKSAWNMLTVGWPARISGDGANGEEDIGASLIKELFIAENSLLSLYGDLSIFPTELNEIKTNPTSISQIRYHADPVVAKLIKRLSNLPRIASILDKGQLISDRPYLVLKRLDISQIDKIARFSLVDVVTTVTPNNRNISPSEGAILSEVINADFEKTMVENNATGDDIQGFSKELSSLHFLSGSQEWSQPSQLLVPIPDDEESNLLYLFAPDDIKLSNHYDSQARKFVSYCRGNSEFDAGEVFDWITRDTVSNSTELIKAICVYVVHGNAGAKLGGLMKSSRANIPWMDKIDVRVLQKWEWSNQDIDSLLNFHWATEKDVDSRVKQQFIENSTPQRPPREILADVHSWWQSERGQYLPKYEGKLYPGGHFPWSLLKEDDRDDPGTRKAWLQLLFLGSCYTMGRTKEEAHRGALDFFEQKGWWNVFLEAGPQDRGRWFEVIDDYLDHALVKSQYRNWLQILPLYRFSRGLNDYVDLFYGAESFLENLDDIVSPSSSERLAGTGISPPELKSTLGIGINFILRELVRNEVMSDDNLASYCFVPSRSVRKIFEKLGCQFPNENADSAHSISIYEFIVDELDEEYATFHNDFDIPFRVLLGDEHSHTRNKIFGFGQLDIEQLNDD